MLIIRIIPVKMTTSGQLSADRALSAAVTWPAGQVSASDIGYTPSACILDYRGA